MKKFVIAIIALLAMPSCWKKQEWVIISAERTESVETNDSIRQNRESRTEAVNQKSNQDR